jgi:hypothetical protein
MPHAHVNARAKEGGGGDYLRSIILVNGESPNTLFTKKKKDSSLKCDKFFCYGELLIVRCFLHVKNNTGHYLIDISRYGGSEYVHC